MNRPAGELLSPRQAQIAAMVAQAKSNREIGESLSLSERTVETHVTAIFNKLGVASRLELVVALIGTAAGTSAEPAATRAAKTNLPLQRTRLVGRETELAEIVNVLETNRLVTLTGAGGIGKTRVALAVGDALVQSMKAGVWLVELAPVLQAPLTAAAVARALNVQESPHRPLLETLLVYLGQKPLLLILDNCEHVIAEAAALADALLSGCTQLRILVTSREPLRIGGEQTYRLPSLPIPSADEAAALCAARAAQYAAVELFVQRAQTSSKTFALDDGNAPIVAEICRRLDGIPLAIELAAARVNILPVPALSIKLDGRFRILTGGDRTALPRHQTLRALIDWSYDLLAPREQRLFERLSIFAGGCTLETAAAVYAGDAVDDIGVLELLSSLVDKSLVVADLAGPEPRYRLLESSGAYAREKLAARGDATAVAHRHALAYVDLAERLEREYDAAPNAIWFARVESELENWRTALEWTLGARRDIVLGQRLAGAMGPTWTNFSLVQGQRWVQTALELADSRTPSALRAHLEYAAACIAYAFGEYEVALAGSTRASAGYREFGDPAGSACAQRLAGTSLAVLGRIAEAEPLLSDALKAARAIGNLRLVGVVLEAVAYASSAAGDLSAARSHLAEALDIYGRIGAERYAANVAGNLAEAEFRAGNVERAVQLMTTLLATMRNLGYGLYITIGLCNLAAYLIACDRFTDARSVANEALDLAQETQLAVFLAYALQRLAAVAGLSPARVSARASPQPAMVARLLGYVDARIVQLGASREYTEQQEYDRVLSALRETLDPDELASFMSGGAAMTQDEAIALARSI